MLRRIEVFIVCFCIGSFGIGDRCIMAQEICITGHGYRRAFCIQAPEGVQNTGVFVICSRLVCICMMGEVRTRHHPLSCLDSEKHWSTKLPLNFNENMHKTCRILNKVHHWLRMLSQTRKSKVYRLTASIR